jgi:6-phosphogluconate dehydrogenase
MQVGMVGLGRMGANLTRRLMRHGHAMVGFDRDLQAVQAVAEDGATPASSLDELVALLAAPRIVWVMLPAGAPTETTVSVLADMLDPGDVVIDGGNTFYKDDARRARTLAERDIHYVDVGTSGGVWGLERGYCMMIGGSETVVRSLDPIFRALAPGRGAIAPTPGRNDADERVGLGYLHAGPAGAGHFVKMIHNGIEYGMMQAFAEGFHLLKAMSDADTPLHERYDIDVADVAEVWRRGSVVSSWLLDLTAQALARDAELSGFSGPVADSGEGRWTIQTAIERAVPAPVLASALFARFRSREEDSYADRMLSAMRHAFGGHDVGNKP